MKHSGGGDEPVEQASLYVSYSAGGALLLIVAGAGYSLSSGPLA